MKQQTYSPVSNSGFITAYFLIIFISLTILVSIETSNILYQNKTLKNITLANKYLAYEAKVLHYLKELDNAEEDDTSKLEETSPEEELEEILEDTVNMNNLVFHYIKNDSTITVDITSPIEESLIIYLEDDQIYDYDAIRYKEN